MKNSAKIKKLLKAARIYQKEIDQLNALYSEYNEIVNELVELKFKFDDKLGVRLVDNFKNKNVVFRTTSVKRFELDFE